MVTITRIEQVGADQVFEYESDRTGATFYVYLNGRFVGWTKMTQLTLRGLGRRYVVVDIVDFPPVVRMGDAAATGRGGLN